MTTATADTEMSGLFVVETYEGQAFLGQLDFGPQDVTVYTGYRGRPPVLARDDIAAIIPVDEHPDVIFARGRRTAT